MYYKFEYNSYSQNYTLYLANNQVDSTYLYFNGSWATGGSTNCAAIIKMGTGNVLLPENCSGLFRNFRITSVPSGLDFSQVKDASYMFAQCYELEYAYISSWNWSTNVTDMSNMFTGCQKLTYIDASGWEVSKVTNFSNMFSMTGTIPTTATQTIKCDNWDTSSATDMSEMFRLCKNLESVSGIDNFKMDNVTNLRYFFYSCKKLGNIDCRNWNVSKCTNFANAFDSCESFTSLNLKNWEVNKNQKVSFLYMFSGCNNLTNIYVGRDVDWREYSNESDRMFDGCTKLPNYNSSSTDATKAYPDEWGGGYLTFFTEWLTGTWYIKDSEGNWLESDLYCWRNSEGTYEEETTYFKC